jgi:glycosyltransferase involved in cell wall biosynthesis
MTNKRDLIIFMPSIEGGGVEKNLFIISNYLSSKIKNIKLITFDKKFINRFNNIDLVTPNIKYRNFGRKVKYFFCLLELLKILIKNDNYLIFAFQANLYCAILKIFFKNIKLITRSNTSPVGWSKNYLKYIIFKILFKKIDIIIVNSKEFKKQIDKKFKIKSFCIYNPLNKKVIKRLAKKKFKLPFFDKKSLKIVNIGRLVDQKDQITFLKSLNEINNKIKFKALIIGNGIYKKKLIKYIKLNKLDKNVKILKFDNNPFKYIYKSDVLVHTAKYEGLPNVLLEAQVLNKYIVSTKCSTGPKEILMNGLYGDLVQVGNFRAISKKLIFFSKNKKKFKKKILNAQKALARFDYYNNLNKYFFVIKKYLN